MKRIFLLSLACTFGVFTMQAQERENVKKETTTKKVTVKDTGMETVVEEDVVEERDRVMVEGNTQTNQATREHRVKNDSTKTIKTDGRQRNIENEESLEQLRKVEERKMQRQKGIETHRTDTISSTNTTLGRTVKANINK